MKQAIINKRNLRKLNSNWYPLKRMQSQNTNKNTFLIEQRNIHKTSEHQRESFSTLLRELTSLTINNS